MFFIQNVWRKIGINVKGQWWIENLSLNKRGLQIWLIDKNVPPREMLFYLVVFEKSKFKFAILKSI
jgi:hypothetical protein